MWTVNAAQNLVSCSQKDYRSNLLRAAEPTIAGAVENLPAEQAS